MPYGGYLVTLEEFSNHPEKRYHPETQGERPLFLPYQSVPHTLAQNRFREISPFGKPGKRGVTMSLAAQPIFSMTPVFVQPATRPKEGRLTVRGYVDARESAYQRDMGQDKGTYTWSP
jgi:hypothetical protein